MSDIRGRTYDDGVVMTAGKVYLKPFAAFLVPTAVTTATVVTAGGTSLSLTGLIPGTIYPIAIQSVTTGTGIIGLKALPFLGSQ